MTNENTKKSPYLEKIWLKSYDDHVKPKPAPDILIEAAWQLKLHPSDCQVFEDGDIGLKAARDAGMIATDIRLYL